MTILRKSGNVPSILRLCVAFGALVVLLTAEPATAREVGFNACSQCHPGMSNSACAGMISVAIVQCCGQTGGWGWCVNSSWGTYVDCSTFNTECQCDSWGNNCDSDFKNGEEGKPY